MRRLLIQFGACCTVGFVWGLVLAATVASWMAIHAVGCAPVSRIDCPDGFELNADGTECVRVPCEGDGCEDPCLSVTCEDGNECTENVCTDVGGTGTCSHPPKPSGTACETDGDPGSCDGGGTCVVSCVETGCDAPSECKQGSTCDTDTGVCFPFPNQDDGTPCTEGVCLAGVCVPGPTWGTAELIEAADAGNSFDPQLAVDPNGNVTAIWRQSGGVQEGIWSNRYSPSGGWGTALLIENNEGSASGPDVAVDSNGNATAVWNQSDGVRDSIWSNRYTPSGGWGTALLIETDDVGGARSPKVAVDANGNATVVWWQYDGVRDNIWSNRHTLSGGWGTALLIENNDTGEARSPKVAVDPDGNATAAWHQTNGTRYSIWSNRYTPSDGWGTAVLIENDETGNAQPPQLAADPDGNVTVVWNQSDGVRNNIWSNRYTPSDRWGIALLIENNDAAGSGPQVAVDPDGNATATWRQSDEDHDTIWSNRYAPSDGWGTPVRIETSDAEDAFGARVAMDSNGNATAVWYQSAGSRNSIWSSRYTPTDGWSAPVRIETESGNASDPEVAVDSAGRATAVWWQDDRSNYSIWSNRFE